MNDSKTADTQYAVRTLLFMGVYSAMNIAAVAGMFAHIRGTGAWVLSLAVSLPSQVKFGLPWL